MDHNNSSFKKDPEVSSAARTRSNVQYSLSDFIPLISIFSVIIVCTFVRALLQPPATLVSISYDFMGFFFLIFGAFKLFKLRDFVTAFAEYDLIARFIRVYGYVYPFIEIAFGILYLAHVNNPWLHGAVIVLLGCTLIGVLPEVIQGKKITCACLGTVFKLPMTYVTVIENLLMIGMAVLMLLKVM